MRSPKDKRLSLHDRFDKFFIEPKFDVVKIDKLLDIVNEYIDEVPIAKTLINHIKIGESGFSGEQQIYGIINAEIALRKILKGEKK